MAEKNYPIKVFYSIFFTQPRWADVAFVWRRPARMRGQHAKPHMSARRAPRRGVNGCADERFVVQPSTFRPQAALGSGFSLQATFWYQNAMLALFFHGEKSLMYSPSPELCGNKFRFFFHTRPEILPFCTLDSVVATIVAMQV